MSNETVARAERALNAFAAEWRLLAAQERVGAPPRFIESYAVQLLDSFRHLPHLGLEGLVPLLKAHRSAKQALRWAGPGSGLTGAHEAVQAEVRRLREHLAALRLSARPVDESGASAPLAAT